MRPIWYCLCSLRAVVKAKFFSLTAIIRLVALARSRRVFSASSWIFLSIFHHACDLMHHELGLGLLLPSFLRNNSSLLLPRREPVAGSPPPMSASRCLHQNCRSRGHPSANWHRHATLTPAIRMKSIGTRHHRGSSLAV